jgi:UDP-GlcNAc:undecaprenyl-phosphate GlcNAc-1-phosphate transferase
VLYLYGWTLTLAALAVALRFVPYSDDDGTLNAGWAAVIACFALIALAASVYLVLVLEILKFRVFREREIRRQVETGEIPALSEDQIEHEIEREVETGEFEAVRPPETDEFEAVGRD